MGILVARPRFWPVLQPAVNQILRPEPDSRHLNLAEDLLRKVEPALGSPGKELVIEIAFLIAYADGDMDESEGSVVMRVANALGVSTAHLKGIMAGFVDRAAA